MSLAVEPIQAAASAAPDPRPGPWSRAAVAAALGVAAAGYVLLFYRSRSAAAVSDFDAIWTAARALRAGLDPYAAIPSPPWPWDLQYPLPAVLVALPFSFLPLWLARAAFMGMSVTLLAWGLTRRVWWPLLALAGGPSLFALQSVQWTPLFTAAVLITPLRALWAVKPTSGFPLFAAYPNRWTVSGALVLFALSFLVFPHWLTGWLAAARRAPHVAAVLRPGGALLLLALIRWRLPEGRQVAAMSLMPLSPHLYEALPLVLVVRSRRELLVLTLWATLAFLAWGLAPHTAGPDHGLVPWLIVLIGAYLPALVVVLRRPNREPGRFGPFEALPPT